MDGPLGGDLVALGVVEGEGGGGDAGVLVAGHGEVRRLGQVLAVLPVHLGHADAGALGEGVGGHVHLHHHAAVGVGEGLGGVGGLVVLVLALVGLIRLVGLVGLVVFVALVVLVALVGLVRLVGRVVLVAVLAAVGGLLSLVGLAAVGGLAALVGFPAVGLVPGVGGGGLGAAAVPCGGGVRAPAVCRGGGVGLGLRRRGGGGLRGRSRGRRGGRGRCGSLRRGRNFALVCERVHGDKTHAEHEHAEEGDSASSKLLHIHLPFFAGPTKGPDGGKEVSGSRADLPLPRFSPHSFASPDFPGFALRECAVFPRFLRCFLDRPPGRDSWYQCGFLA